MKVTRRLAGLLGVPTRKTRTRRASYYGTQSRMRDAAKRSPIDMSSLSTDLLIEILAQETVVVRLAAAVRELCRRLNIDDATDLGPDELAELRSRIQALRAVKPERVEGRKVIKPRKPASVSSTLLVRKPSARL